MRNSLKWGYEESGPGSLSLHDISAVSMTACPTGKMLCEQIQSMLILPLAYCGAEAEEKNMLPPTSKYLQ